MRTEMGSVVGVVQVPHVRWGGRWASDLAALDCVDGDCRDWQELAEYGVTTGYQVARALNLGSSIPTPPAGKRFEFGSRVERDGTSRLLVRVVDA